MNQSGQARDVALLPVIIISLAILPLLCVDLIVPSMPIFARDLQASVTQTQMSLSVFALCFGGMHLVYGPLADRFGRKPILYTGSSLLLLASILAANAPTIDLLILARALQGIGAAVGPLVARAVIRDVYGNQGAGRMMGLVMASFGICAIVAPIFGGQLVEWMEWRAPFWTAAAYALALLFLIWRAMPETLPKAGGEPLNLRELLRRYWMLLTDVRFILVAFCGSSVNCAMFAWISGSGIVVQNVYGYSPTMHGVIFAASVLGFVLMSFLSARLAPKYGSARLIRIGLIITSTGGVVGLVTGLLVPPDSLWPLIGVFLVMVGHGFALPQSLALAIQPFPLIAASASALFGFLQYVGGAIVSTLNGALFDNTAVPMLGLMALTTLAPALAWFLFSGRLLRSQES